MFSLNFYSVCCWAFHRCHGQPISPATFLRNNYLAKIKTTMVCVMILNSELSERTKQHALQAARAYGHALTLHMTGEIISHAQAHQAMQNLILAYGCQLQISQEDGVSWRESDYYDDIDRLEASFMSDIYLAEIVGEDKSYVFPKNYCEALFTAVGSVQ